MEQTAFAASAGETALHKPVEKLERSHSSDVGGKVAVDQSCSQQQAEEQQQQHLAAGAAHLEAESLQQAPKQALNPAAVSVEAGQQCSPGLDVEPAAEAAAPLAQPPRDACLAWMEAAKEGDMRELYQLLQHYPGLLNYQPPSGLQCSALHWVAARGHADALQGLLLWGADPAVLTCTGSTPLHSAAASNRMDCAELLLLVPAVLQQLEWANEDGLTPAALALKHGHKLMQGMLLQAAEAAAAGRPVSSAAAALGSQVAGTTVEGGLGVGLASGAAAVWSASQSRSMQAALSQQPVLQGLRSGFLLPNAARRQQVLSSSDEEDEASPSSGSSSPGSRAATDAALLSGVGGGSSVITGQQPAAAAKAEQVVVQQEMPAATGTAVAAAAGTSSSQQPVVNRASSSSSGNVGAAAGLDRQLGRSWLDAARAGDLRLLQAMAAAHPQLITYCGLGTSYALIGNSALHWCAAKGHVRCLEWLLQQGALQVSTLLNQADATALHTAAEHGQAACAQLLVLRGGADVQQLDGLGQSAVQAAAGVGHTALAQQLLLWEVVLQMDGTDRSSWSVGSMQKVLRLAGRASDVAACAERHELQTAVMDVLHKLMQCT